MLHIEYIEYLKRENKSNFDEYLNYYIQRKLRRFIQIDKKILDGKKRNEETKKNYIIVHSEEDFNLKCHENNQKESIHLLKLVNDNQNLIWQKSSGPISDLTDFIIKNEESCLSIEEGKILDQSEKVLIISTEPGMGKSLILDKLFFDSNSETFCFKIVLNNFTVILSNLKEKKESLENQENILDFILMRFLEKKNELEISLLKHLAQEQKLILMFDGLDEVIDYKDEVKHLIKLLRESCQFKMILITTRNHLRSDLEDFFSTISFGLNEIDADEQINFLKKYWRNLNLKSNRYTRIEDLEHSSKELVDKMRSSLNSKINEILGIPLQTKMIADIYFDKLNSKEDFSTFELSNLADLYDKFVEKKFSIQFIEKWKQEKTQNQDDYEEKKEKFYEGHIKYSLMILMKNNEKEKRSLKKFGIIVDFKDKVPIFLHQSYAEYFLAKYVVNIIKEIEDDKNQYSEIDQNNKVDQEFNQILSNEEFFLVRKFLNDLLPEFKTTFEAKINLKLQLKLPIENCCRENLFNILNYLIMNKNSNITSKNQFLLLASLNGHKEIVQLLIQKGIDINQTYEDGENTIKLDLKKSKKSTAQSKLKEKNIIMKDGLDFYKKFQNKIPFLLENVIDQTDSYGLNALHLSSENGHKEVVQLLLEKGIDINQTNTYGQNGLHLASANGHLEIAKLLIENGIDVNLNDKTGCNALIQATFSNNREIGQLLIEKGIDINQTDLNGLNATNWALICGHKEILELLIEKGSDINQTDFYGLNAIHLASICGHKDKAKFLIEKGIDINQTDSTEESSLDSSLEKDIELVLEDVLEKSMEILPSIMVEASNILN